MTDALDLGAAVRRAREQSGLSLEDVSTRTRIRVGLLRDLERGRTERCGGSVYVRGHLKAIARATGAAPEPLLATLDPLDAPDADSGPVARALGPGALGPGGALGLPHVQRERGRPRWGLAGALAAAVLVVLALVDLGRTAPTTGAAPAAAPAPVATPTADAAPPAAPPPSPAPPPAAALRVEAHRGASWVSVSTATGTSLFRGVLAAGTAKEFSDPARLQVTLGNPGVVTVACGGTRVPTAGRSVVRHYTCDPAGPVL